MSFSNVLDQYEIVNSTVSFRQISNSELKHLGMKINQLRYEIFNTYEHDEHLFEVLNVVKKCFFKLITGLNTYEQIITKDLEGEVLRSLTQVKNSYPELFSSLVLDVGKLIKGLSETKDNSLQESIINYIQEKKEKTGLKVVIVSKSALSEEEKELVKKSIDSSLKLQFLTFSSFRKSLVVFDEVIYIGNPDYFGETAKRNFKSSNITFFSYDFFSNKIIPRNILDEIDSQGVFSTLYDHVSFEKTLEFKEEISLVEREYKEEAVNQLIERSVNGSDKGQENVETKVVTLENNRIIFIPTDAKVRVFSPNVKNKVVVQKSFIDVEEDDFIVIRNESDTKLIAEVADREILRENAIKFRHRQKHWKKRLRSNVDKKGLKGVSDILFKKYKMKTSYPASVRFWCSDDSICPTEIKLLLKALKYNQEEVQKISDTMNVIKRAHISAGSIISKKLMFELSELSNEIHTELQEKGYYTFRSHEFDGASFNIERVVSIDNTIRTVPSTNIMRVMSLD
ncbi:hypothetical protein GLW08_12685 [Pontibacillus yanchengensis]|uniref:Uncharacterized protein n=1 Tax=Pontibacillus yanchengensis TaxID=462910 RepID=A0ACC7VJ78_9BACI|nr:DrmE family protein [Pontibacillus yanchengensis]MYL54194.1 hypothetical protein [Pontibacillus yanchengensis]